MKRSQARAEILAKEGFVVMPYMYPDLNAARDLVKCWGSCSYASWVSN
ncbi:MAG: hypothetical protein ACLVFD_06565 [Anaerostipes hadrus]